MREPNCIQPDKYQFDFSAYSRRVLRIIAGCPLTHTRLGIRRHLVALLPSEVSMTWHPSSDNIVVSPVRSSCGGEAIAGAQVVRMLT